MPAQVYKGTILFSYAAWGWSENFYLSAEDPDAAASKLQAINTKRLELSGQSINVIRMRVSNVAIRGDVKLIDPEVTSGQDGAVGDAIQHPDIAVLLRAANVPLYNVSQWLRGLRQAHFNGPYFNPSAGWLTHFSDYVIAVKANAVLRVKSKTAPIGDIITVTITDISRIGSREHKTGRPFGLPLGRRRRRRPT